MRSGFQRGHSELLGYQKRSGVINKHLGGSGEHGDDAGKMLGLLVAQYEAFLNFLFLIAGGYMGLVFSSSF